MNYSSINHSIAKKYSQAFITVAGYDLIGKYYEHIVLAQKRVVSQTSILFFLQLPHLDDSRKQVIIDMLLEEFLLPPIFQKIIFLLIAHSRLYYLSTVLFYVLELYRKKINRVYFLVVTSHSLNQSQQDHIQHILGRKINSQVICNYRINKKLIAGIRIQSADYIWEYSVRKHLVALRALEI